MTVGIPARRRTSTVASGGGASRGGATSARACLEHLCRALAQLGVGRGSVGGGHQQQLASGSSSSTPDRDGVESVCAGSSDALVAETLRRAKFDQPSAAAPLWRTLHDLVVLGVAGFPDPDTATAALAKLRGHPVRNLRNHHPPPSEVDASMSGEATEADAEEDEACARLVRRYLAAWGYPRADDLDATPARNGPSRPLLVALAWLVRRSRRARAWKTPARQADGTSRTSRTTTPSDAVHRRRSFPPRLRARATIDATTFDGLIR